jgi:hypothetical protein
VAAARGDHGAARSRYREAAGVAATKGAFTDAARAVDALAALEAAEGAAERAARLSGAAAALRGGATGGGTTDGGAAGGPPQVPTRADALRLAGLDEEVIEAVSRR